MLSIPLLLPLLSSLALPPQDRARVYDELVESVHTRVQEWVCSRSEVPALRGAWYAGEYGLERLVPDLIDRLRFESGRPENTWKVTRRTVLDALIRLDAKVPAEVLMTGLDDELLTETLLLLARDPAANADAILTLMDRGEPGAQHRWAAAAILLSVRPPGLAQRLVKELDARLFLTVSDEDKHLSHFESSGGRWVTSHDIFPPRVFYYLHPEPRRGFAVLTGGPSPVFVERFEATRSASIPDTLARNQRTDRALDHLAKLLDVPAQDLVGISDGREACVIWNGEEDLRIRVRQHVEAQGARFEKLVARLVAAGLLTDGETANLIPAIELVVEDSREGDHAPLPARLLD